MKFLFAINQQGNIVSAAQGDLTAVLSEDTVLEPVGRSSDEGIDFYNFLDNSDLLVEGGGTYSTPIDYFPTSIAARDALSPSEGERCIVSHDANEYVYTSGSWVLAQERGHYVVAPGNQELDLPFYILINAGKPHTIDRIAAIALNDPYDTNIGPCNLKLSFGDSYDQAKNEEGTNTNWNLSAGLNQLSLGGETFTWLKIEADSGSNFTNRNFMPFAMAVSVSPVDGDEIGEGDIWGPLSENQGSTFEDYIAVNHRRKADSSENPYPSDQFLVSNWQRVFAFGDLNLFSTGQFSVLSKSGSNWNVDINAGSNPDAANLGFNQTEQFGFNPTPEGGLDFDSDLEERSIGGTGSNRISMVIARKFPHYNLPTDQFSVYEFGLPWDDGYTPYDLNSAQTFAKACFMMAARYGSSTAANNAWITPFLYTGNTLQKGLGYIHAIELGNEFNRYWFRDDSNPFNSAHADVIEGAILFNAGYDGMMGTYGDGYGVKDGDPNLLVSISSTVEVQKGYIFELIQQIIKMRQDVYDANPSIDLQEYPINPFDNGNVVVNIHKYTTDGGSQQSGSGGAPPEQAPHYFEELRSVMKFVNAVTDNPTEVWLTEQGYDNLIAGEGSRVGVPIRPSDGDLANAKATGDITGTNFDGPYYAQAFNRPNYLIGTDIVFTGPQSNPTQITIDNTKDDLSFIQLKDRIVTAGSRYLIDDITDNGNGTTTYDVTVAEYDGTDAAGTILSFSCIKLRSSLVLSIVI
jgi:hypothetical protein